MLGVGQGGGVRLLLIVGYMGRLHPKVLPFLHLNERVGKFAVLVSF